MSAWMDACRQAPPALRLAISCSRALAIAKANTRTARALPPTSHVFRPQVLPDRVRCITHGERWQVPVAPRRWAKCAVLGHRVQAIVGVAAILLLWPQRGMGGALICPAIYVRVHGTVCVC